MTRKERVLAHWRRIREDARGAYDKNNESPGPYDCAFCQELGCHRCPIAVKTGKSFCDGTPYYKAQDAWRNFVMWESGTESEWQAAADQMIAFLEDLPDD